MDLVPVFHGSVTADGQLVLAGHQREQRRRYLEGLSNKDVDVIVKPRRNQRSLDQNAYWHGVPFKLLREHLGYESVDELKVDLMGECWGWTKTKSGHDIPVKVHTSQLTTDEGAWFTEWLVRFGAQLPSPCLIPMPNEVEVG
jgi:hypothetical protein